MGAPSPHNEDDLSDVERRLADWRPASAGLDADAMLFAAGQATARRGRGRLLWPALCVLLAGQAAVLGAWGFSERAERVALASRLHEIALEPKAPPATAVAVLPQSSYAPSPDDYFHLRGRTEQDLDRWLTLAHTDAPAPGPPPPEPTIPRAGQRHGVFDQ
jgi:hypothetical protein